MVTKQLRDLPENADLRRADSLAREIFSDVANKWAMLTQNLRMLERNGLVDRKVHPTVPPKVEYTLTEPGRALRATVDLICGWTHEHLRHIESARDRFDA
jgi:DNA-binding HxlR family transcriptional regulator